MGCCLSLDKAEKQGFASTQVVIVAFLSVERLYEFSG